MRYYDSEGTEIKAGTTVRFSYGIPPVGVKAKIVRRGGRLVVLTPGHNPASAPVHILKRSVGDVYVER